MLLPEGYTEIGVVDEGPSGPITVARPPRGGTPVALVLVPRPYDPTLTVRLSALKALRHRSIASLLDWVETEEGLVLVGELVDGVPLRALLDSTGLLPAEASLVVLRDSLLGAATANDAGLPRGDHRPETLMLTRKGEIRLLDVGLTTVARPPYLAPEVWEGGPATPASDVYAATAVLVECVSGSPPYGAGEDLGELRARHLRAPIPVERVPEALRSLVLHGLDKDPRERCAEARLLLLELAAVAGGAFGSVWERRGREQLVAAVRPLEFLFPPPRLLVAGSGAAGRTAERRDRRRAAAAILVAAALLAVVGGSLALRHGGSPTGPVTGAGGGQTSELAPLTIPGATPTPTPSPTPAPTPQPTPQPTPTPAPSPAPAPAPPAPTATPTPRLLPTVTAAPPASPTPTPAPLTATGVSKLAFQRCTAGPGGFVCPFTITFDWDDPGGTGGTIAWHLSGDVVSQTTGCTRPVAFSVAETTTVPQEQPGSHSASISGNLTVSADPAGPSAQNPSTAKASLDASGASVGPVPFYGGSTC